MTLTPSLRRLALTAHVTSSVGWLGAVAAFLALAVAGLTSQDAQLARCADLAMNLTAWFVIVPLCFASLLTGIVSSLGTPWGLFRHYWVLFSLVLTSVAAFVVIEHMQSVSYFAAVAVATPAATVGELPVELFHAGVGLLVLLVIQVMNV